MKRSEYSVQIEIFLQSQFVFLILVLTAVGFASGCAGMNHTGNGASSYQVSIVFPPDSIDPRLQTTLDRHQFVYIQEAVGSSRYAATNQDFLLRLLHIMSHPRKATLDGGNPMAPPIMLLREAPHALGWIVEDYVLGRRDNYPPDMPESEQVMLQELRRWNEGGCRIHYRYTGLNTNPHDAVRSLYALGVETGILPRFVELLATVPGTPEYQQEILRLSHLFAGKKGYFRGKIGDLWYERLTEVIDTELRSIPLRDSYDSFAHERLLMYQVERAAGSACQISQHRCFFITDADHVQLREFLSHGYRANPGHGMYFLTLIGPPAQDRLQFSRVQTPGIVFLDQGNTGYLVLPE
ncbi:MAG: hypothetical protein ACOCVC_04545 [Spirochaeta sp.]